jgi:hypothetical protein
MNRDEGVDPHKARPLAPSASPRSWRSELEPFRKTALTLADNAEAICNAIRLGLNNARIEP